MSIGRILSAADISASGLKAERTRMEVVANNIANMHSTRTPQGGPYRRQQVVFSEAMAETESSGADGLTGLKGVNVVGVIQDQSELPSVYDPSHPDADARGYVSLPNVKLPHEMVDLMVASRSYEANLKSLQTFKQMAETTLSVLRDIG
ncbi:flagellar basal body rod protein FlgC [Planctomyces sp. SH-PL14]|uniref:flagellar basal body rod protein FlgC n=1 Tax=Planctomyces sp. SH-PL14 TaxID=1632864 RepID=UPI00078D4A1C|nr:flagellar basal body rod protein FlgC [Planctomyces sp. SH-PL14]AMV21568.1 Flagellar basal-body rod protein FlgC [Planctomyces sp. SH-PL14]